MKASTIKFLQDLETVIEGKAYSDYDKGIREMARKIMVKENIEPRPKHFYCMAKEGTSLTIESNENICSGNDKGMCVTLWRDDGDAVDVDSVVLDVSVASDFVLASKRMVDKLKDS